MKKKLNIDSITNELEGASLFFKKSAAPPSVPEPKKTLTEKDANLVTGSPFFEKTVAPPPQAQSENNQDQKRTNVLSDVRTTGRTDEHSVIKLKRQKIRHAFDIYEDQLFALQMRQLEAVQRSKRKPKLGKMVQEAIDLYLKQAENNRKQA